MWFTEAAGYFFFKYPIIWLSEQWQPEFFRQIFNCFILLFSQFQQPKSRSKKKILQLKFCHVYLDDDQDFGFGNLLPIADQSSLVCEVNKKSLQSCKISWQLKCSLGQILMSFPAQSHACSFCLQSVFKLKFNNKFEIINCFKYCLV